MSLTQHPSHFIFIYQIFIIFYYSDIFCFVDVRLFNEQDAEYKAKVVDLSTKVLAATEYYHYADDVLGMESFGASAPADLLFEKFGFTQEGIMKRACVLMDVEYREVTFGECKL